jgi:hypothetical protein
MARHREFAIKEELMIGNPCSQIYEERVEQSSWMPKTVEEQTRLFAVLKEDCRFLKAPSMSR